MIVLHYNLFSVLLFVVTTLTVGVCGNDDANSLLNRATAMARFRSGLQLHRAKAAARITQGRARELAKSRISLTSAPKWWHYYPPWWLPPKADKELPKPDWSHSDLGSYTINPQDDVVPYYNPYDSIMLEVDNRIIDSHPTSRQWHRAYTLGIDVPAELHESPDNY